MLIQNVILSYPHLFEPRAVNPGDDAKYSVSLLVPKDHPQIAEIMQAVETAKANGFPSGFPHNGKVCFKEASESQPGDTRLQGYYEIRTSATADSKPHVVDTSVAPIMDRSAVYAGCMAHVDVNFFSYNKPMSKGVAGGLNGVMITGQEGALGRLDGRPTVDQMFGAIAGQAPAAATPAPVAQPAPVAPAAAPAAPAPMAPPAAPAAPAVPQYVMTEKAGGYTRDQYLASGWTDEALIAQGMMIAPSFN